MCAYRVAVGACFVGVVYANNYQEALRKAKDEFVKVSGLELLNEKPV